MTVSLIGAPSWVTVIGDTISYQAPANFLADLTFQMIMDNGCGDAPTSMVVLLTQAQVTGDTLQPLGAGAVPHTLTHRFTPKHMAGLKREFPWGEAIAINREPQYYLAESMRGTPPAPFILPIRTHKRTQNDYRIIAARSPADLLPHLTSQHNGSGPFIERTWVSGCFTTEPVWLEPYGWVEIDMTAPIGSGFWTGLWLFSNPDNPLYELDIELDGNRPTEMFPNQHNPPELVTQYSSPVNVNGIWLPLPNSGRIDAPHTWGMRRTNTTSELWFDGVKLWETPNVGNGPVQLHVNVAVSNNTGFISNTGPNSPSPVELVLTEIRVFKDPAIVVGGPGPTPPPSTPRATYVGTVASAGVNLAANGDFSGSTVAPWVPINADTTGAVSNGVLRINPIGNNQYASFKQTINITPGHLIEVGATAIRGTSGTPPAMHLGAPYPGTWSHYGRELPLPGVYQFVADTAQLEIWLADGDTRPGFYNDFDNVTIIDLSVPFDVRMVSPAPTSTIAGASSEFTWSGDRADEWRFTLGSTLGGTEFADVTTTGTSATVSGLPTDGSTVYATLYARLNGGDWTSVAAEYDAFAGVIIATPASAVIIQPMDQILPLGNSQYLATLQVAAVDEIDLLTLRLGHRGNQNTLYDATMTFTAAELVAGKAGVTYSTDAEWSMLAFEVIDGSSNASFAWQLRWKLAPDGQSLQIRLNSSWLHFADTGPDTAGVVRSGVVRFAGPDGLLAATLNVSDAQVVGSSRYHVAGNQLQVVGAEPMTLGPEGVYLTSPTASPTTYSVSVLLSGITITPPAPVILTNAAADTVVGTLGLPDAVIVGTSPFVIVGNQLRVGPDALVAGVVAVTMTSPSAEGDTTVAVTINPAP